MASKTAVAPSSINAHQSTYIKQRRQQAEAFMLRRTLLSFVALLAIACGTSQAHAGSPGAYSGFPFGYGFYQPYGVRYSTSVRTPPYFAVNPPVYYGARHYRPYGASPFASLPLLEAGDGYVTRPATEFVRPPQSAPVFNPYCAGNSERPANQLAEVSPIQDAKVAPIRQNPYAAQNVAALGK